MSTVEYKIIQELIGTLQAIQPNDTFTSSFAIVTDGIRTPQEIGKNELPAAGVAVSPVKPIIYSDQSFNRSRETLPIVVTIHMAIDNNFGAEIDDEQERYYASRRERLRLAMAMLRDVRTAILTDITRNGMAIKTRVLDAISDAAFANPAAQAGGMISLVVNLEVEFDSPFVEVSGMSYGEVNSTVANETIVIPPLDNNIWTAWAPTLALNTEASRNFGLVSGGLQYTGLRTIKAQINVAMSVAVTGATGENPLKVGLVRTRASVASSLTTSRQTVNADPTGDSLSIVALVELRQGDTITFEFSKNTSIDTFLLASLSMTVTEVG